ncbi:MAG: hypothetical protein AAFQ61_02220 [Cyanobacteria bacterium J06626_23]
MAKGLSPEDVMALRDLVDECDGNYNLMIAKLAEMGAADIDYALVNKAIKDEMGKEPSAMVLTDEVEVETWNQGYEGSLEEISNVETAPIVANKQFKKAKRETGWRLF